MHLMEAPFQTMSAHLSILDLFLSFLHHYSLLTHLLLTSRTFSFKVVKLVSLNLLVLPLLYLLLFVEHQVYSCVIAEILLSLRL